MELLALVAVVAIPVFLFARIATQRHRDDPTAHAWGMSPWLLGGLFFWNHGADTHTQPASDLGADTGLSGDAGTWGITGGGDLGSGQDFGGGGGDFGGGGI